MWLWKRLFVISVPVLLTPVYAYIVYLAISQSDTREILNKLPLLDACLIGGHIDSCKSLAWFAPLQFLVALVPYRLNLNVLIITDIFILLNVFALGWILFRGYQSLKEYYCCSVLLVLAVIFSPALTFAGTTYAEMLIALGAVMVYFGITNKNLYLSFFGALIATLGKDIALLLIPFSATLLFFSRNSQGRSSYYPLVTAFVGTFVGACIGGLFNYLRFGSLLNTVYISPHLKVIDFPSVVSSFLAFFFSPTGGILFYWPLLLPLIGLSFFASFKNSPLNKTKAWTLLFSPPSLTLAILIATAFIHAFWKSPFGWDGWGNRLGAPWTLFATVVLITECAPLLEQIFLKKFWVRALLIILLLPAVLLSASHLYVIFDWNQIVPLAYTNLGECSNHPTTLEKEYYCLHRAFWDQTTLPLLALFQPRHPIIHWVSLFILSGISLAGALGIQYHVANNNKE